MNVSFMLLGMISAKNFNLLTAISHTPNDGSRVANYFLAHAANPAYFTAK